MPSTIPNGDVSVPTGPSPSVKPPLTIPPGLIAVDPNTGTQTALATGSPFVNPYMVVEAPIVFIHRFTPPPPAPLVVADGTAGSGGIGAIIEYSPTTGSASIVVDSGTNQSMNDPESLAFMDGYLYVAYCHSHTLFRFDPTNGWSSAQVTVNGMSSGFFTVVTDLKPVPGHSNELYLLDEGGFINDSGAGQVYLLTFSDSLHATETTFGPQFPTGNNNDRDYRHPQGMTQDLSNPSSVDPIVLSASIGGSTDTLVQVDATTGFTVLSTAGYLLGGDGLAMGSGPYGSNTIFMPTIAYGGPPPNPVTPAQVSAINRLNTGQEEALPNSIGGNLNGPTGPCIYVGSGGGATAPSGSLAVALAADAAQSNRPDIAAQRTDLSSPRPDARAGAPLVVLSSQALALTGPGERAIGSVPAQAINQVSQPNTAVDSLFMSLDAAVGVSMLPGGIVF